MAECVSSWKEHFSRFRSHAAQAGFTVEDEEDCFLDGSEVEFRIAEIPGWKFGVEFGEWPIGPVGMFFWQPEGLIDEFVPDESADCFVVKAVFDAGSDYLTFNVLDEALAFTRDEPALSYCRALDYPHWKYRYMSREEAERIMAESRAKEAKTGE